jgi:protein-S-isoprenylcysteine O-methyltransferase Ste14
MKNNYSLGIDPREDEHMIVQDGPYRLIRNPIYLSYLLGFGAIIPLSLFYGFLAWIIIIVPLYVIRLLREEKRLEEKYGQEYLEYKKGTYRLIPFIF